MDSKVGSALDLMLTMENEGGEMANSLRAKLSKLRHDGHITDAEYQAFIKKMDGHDAEIRNKAIEDFTEALRMKCIEDTYNDVHLSQVFKIAEQMKGGAE